MVRGQPMFPPALAFPVPRTASNTVPVRAGIPGKGGCIRRYRRIDVNVDFLLQILSTITDNKHYRQKVLSAVSA